MTNMAKENFGEILARYRKKGNFTQEDIANPELKLSASHIALLESSGGGDRERKTPLSRKQVWYLVEHLNIFPPDLDDFLDTAGQTILRDDHEELFIQKNYPDLNELWIFAKVIRDLDEGWYETVRDNILRGVKYCYFTSNDRVCRDLVEELLTENGFSEKIIKEKIECFLLPDEFFLTNLAIYNPQENSANMYCCGGIAMYGKAISFYTRTESETKNLYDTLKDLKRKIEKGRPIALPDARYIQLPIKDDDSSRATRSVFTQRKTIN